MARLRSKADRTPRNEPNGHKGDPETLTPTRDLLKKLLRVPKDESDEVHRNHSNGGEPHEA